MHCTASSINEVMEWVDIFTFTTGIHPSHSVRIFAELSELSLPELFALVSEREMSLTRVEVGSDLELEAHNDLISEIELGTDEVLEDMDEEEYDERVDHYIAVLDHHGLNHHYVDFFLEHISPTSGYRFFPEEFGIDKLEALRARAFDEEGFNPEPYEADDFDEDDDIEIIEQVEAEIQQLYEVAQLTQTLDPTGWMAVVKFLGLPLETGVDVIKCDVGLSMFHLSAKEGEPIPVFILNVGHKPFDEDSQALAFAKHTIENKAVELGNPRAIVFFRCPGKVKDLRRGYSLTFWGQTLVNGGWSEMVLHSQSRSVERIIQDSKFISRDPHGFNWGDYCDLNDVVFNEFAKFNEGEWDVPR
jgi:hypothetical protein